MVKAIMVGIGGFFGAVSRYLVDAWVSTAFGPSLPLSTLIVNVSGSFLLGFVFAAFLEGLTHNHHLSLLLAYGFIGAYTTYSAFMMDSIKLAGNSGLSLAIMNIAFSLVFGILAIYLGLFVGRTV